MECLYRITLGSSYATDCALCLSRKNEGTKEYAIESVAWKVLSCWWDILRQTDVHELNNEVILDVVWNEYDGDMMKEVD